MLKRTLLLCLGLWLIAASGLSAHAGPCSMEKIQPAIAAPAQAHAHAHCDMLAASEPAAPDVPLHPDTDANCCCPAVLAALPSASAPDTAPEAFVVPASFARDARAVSRTLAPEPYPPKA